VGAHIVQRTTSKGQARYHVRVAVGGRRENGGRLIHLGSFGTRREAEACRQWASMELAAGRIPDRRRALIDELAARQTLRDAADAWIASRLDLAASTVHTYASHVHESVGARLPLWGLHVRAITMADVQAFVQGLVDAGVAPATTRRYVSVVKQTLDHVDVSPNPARDPRLRLPSLAREQPDPPSTREVVLILENVSKRHRLVVALLEATGLRVSELLGLAWGDVDLDASRFRVARGKTAKARRFVPVPVELCERVAALCPLEDRRAERRVFGGLSRETVCNAMSRACRNAGIPLYSPHDLRHRCLSRRVQLGEPVAEVQRDAGHSRASMLLDTYTHVLVDTVEAWREADL
jgi:integrase